jgi:hypothetical protein
VMNLRAIGGNEANGPSWTKSPYQARSDHFPYTTCDSLGGGSFYCSRVDPQTQRATRNLNTFTLSPRFLENAQILKPKNKARCHMSGFPVLKALGLH